MALVAIDPGHGGSDPGAIFDGRQEKDDALALAMEVGSILENNGIDVFYTRTDDIYETPFKKATDANNSGADLFVSIHRNSGINPNTYNGTQALVYDTNGIRNKLAENINNKLVNIGFKDNGIVERPNLVVLKRTKMPAVLMEVGFINNDDDNQMFDNNFNKIANAIAQGIMETLYEENLMASKAENYTEASVDNGYYTTNEEEIDGLLYRVQAGAFKNKEYAVKLLASLINDGFPAYIIYEDNLYKVQVGAFKFLPNAIRMEQRLRRYRYNTYITT